MNGLLSDGLLRRKELKKNTSKGDDIQAKCPGFNYKLLPFFFPPTGTLALRAASISSKCSGFSRYELSYYIVNAENNLTFSDSSMSSPQRT